MTPNLAVITTKWIAGWNIPGYLPDAEPVEFDNWQDAQTYLIDELKYHHDDHLTQLEVVLPTADAEREADRVFLPVRKLIEFADAGVNIEAEAHGYVYWLYEEVSPVGVR